MPLHSLDDLPTGRLIHRQFPGNSAGILAKVGLLPSRASLP